MPILLMSNPTSPVEDDGSMPARVGSAVDILGDKGKGGAHGEYECFK